MAVTPEAGALAIEEAATRPYQEATDHLRRDHRIGLSKQTLETLTQTVGDYWLEQDQRDYEHLEAATRQGGLPRGVDETPDQCVIYADGVMVHTDGAWHEARVGVVRCEHGEQTSRRSVARLSDPHTFGRQLWSTAATMGCHQAGTCAFIADGSHWLWRMCDRHFDNAIRILDFYHLAEHVHACADVHFGEGGEAARAWALATLGTLRAGQVDAALGRVEALPARSKAKRAAKHELITYLSNNRGRMDYPRYEALGLPIGSGEVESACKTLVQKRCKQSGMRWSGGGLQALLRVRCAVRDGDYHRRFGHWPINLTAWQARRKAA